MPGPLLRLRRLVREGPSDAPGRVVDGLGRVGLAGYGAVHLLVGWLALQIAVGVRNASADADGAVGTIGRSPGGLLVLAFVAVGLVAFAVWQLTAAAVGFRWVSGGERFRKRFGAVSKAVAVLAVAAVVVDYLRGKAAGRTSAGMLAGDVLMLPGGRVLLGAVAVVILAIAGGMVYTGVRRTFMGDLDVRDLAPRVRRAIELVGAVGTLARAVAFAVVGLLVGTAAVRANPDRAGGLDAALRALATTFLGASLLVVVALGFAAYGVYCLVDAAIRRA